MDTHTPKLLPSVITYLIFEEGTVDHSQGGTTTAPVFRAARDLPTENAAPSTALMDFLQETDAPSGLYFVMQQPDDDGPNREPWDPFVSVRRYKIERETVWNIL